MDTRTAVVVRTLEALGVPVDISSVQKRKQIQKAIYLAKQCGVPLDFAYNWYAMGPYSPSLTEKYFGEDFTRVANGDRSELPELSGPVHN